MLRDLSKMLNPTSVEDTLAAVASQPIDWVQLRLWAELASEERVKTGMNALIFARAALRSTLQERFPEKSIAEINMKVLMHFTKLRTA
jgi:hypothetical protein